MVVLLHFYSHYMIYELLYNSRNYKVAKILNIHSKSKMQGSPKRFE